MIITVIESNLVFNFLLKVTATFTADIQCYMKNNMREEKKNWIEYGLSILKKLFSLIFESYMVNIKENTKKPFTETYFN